VASVVYLFAVLHYLLRSGCMCSGFCWSGCSSTAVAWRQRSAEKDSTVHSSARSSLSSMAWLS